MILMLYHHANDFQTKKDSDGKVDILCSQHVPLSIRSTPYGPRESLCNFGRKCLFVPVGFFKLNYQNLD
jgi:hypothetical protein